MCCIIATLAARYKAYPLGYVEGLSDARMMLADFFSSLLIVFPNLNKTDRISH